MILWVKSFNINCKNCKSFEKRNHKIQKGKTSVPEFLFTKVAGLQSPSEQLPPDAVNHRCVVQRGCCDELRESQLNYCALNANDGVLF